MLRRRATFMNFWQKNFSDDLDTSQSVFVLLYLKTKENI